MQYEGLIIRPPSEASSLILQVTVGCSHNRCIFCPAYKAKRFRIKSLQEIRSEIDDAHSFFPALRRVFLADGDALIIPQARLLEILNHLHLRFPILQRIGSYANVKSILRKSIPELRELRERKLGILYLGIESGDDQTLSAVRKGATFDTIVEAASRVKEAGIKLSVTVLLGVGGKERSGMHALRTAELLTRIQPEYVGALTLMLIPEAPIYSMVEEGLFALPSPFELLGELRTMIAASELKNCLFFSNHASNYFPIKARLPRDKEKCVHMLDRVLAQHDSTVLTPEYRRAL